MVAIVVVWTVFDPTVLEPKAENMCLHTKEMPEPIVMFNIESAGQVYNQTNEIVYHGENVNRNAHEVDPFGGICGTHEGYKTVEVRDVRRIVRA